MCDLLLLLAFKLLLIAWLVTLVMATCRVKMEDDDG
jgi:hypothetical protein